MSSAALAAADIFRDDLESNAQRAAGLSLIVAHSKAEFRDVIKRSLLSIIVRKQS